MFLDVNRTHNVYIKYSALGIVPMFCEEIFNGIQKKKDEGSTAEFEVRISSIINEIFIQICKESVNVLIVQLQGIYCEV